MQYVIHTDTKVCGKRNGDIITSEEIVAARGNEKKLLWLGSIKEVINAPKAIPAVKEAPAIQQEEVPVFNSLNNEQGDK